MTSTKSSSSGYDEKVSKKSGVIEKTIHKFSATTSLMGNSKANTPAPPPRGAPVTQSVIKGSFEITKTEADISQKKDTPPAQFQTTPGGGGGGKATTVKVRNGGSGGGKFGAVPAVSAAARPNLGKIDKIEKVNSTTSTTTTTTTTTTSTPTLMPSTSTSSSMSTTTVSTSLSPPEPETNYNRDESNLGNVHKYPDGNEKDLPQLDVNLFTSAPILDSQPWHPINPSANQGSQVEAAPAPSTGDQRKPVQRKGHPATPSTAAATTHTVVEHKPPSSSVPVVQQIPVQKVASSSSGDGDLELKRTKLMETVTRAPSRPIYYQSFTNLTFSLTTMGIERLGAADVRPYPLPVNKLYNDHPGGSEGGQAGAASPLDTGMHLNEREIMNGGGDGASNAQVALDEEEKVLLVAGYDERFEHLGGGVSAKKPEAVRDTEEKQMEKGTPVTAPTKTTELRTSTPSAHNPSEENQDQNEELGEILLDLLELNQKQQQPQQRHKYIPEGEEEVTAITDDDEEEDDQGEEEASQSSESTTKLNFINIREHILHKNKVAMETTTTTTNTAEGEVVAAGEQTLVSTSATSSTGSKLNTPEPQTVVGAQETLMGSSAEDKPHTSTADLAPNDKPEWSGPSLFPMHTTWELINGTVTDQKPDPSHLRRVYNDTLQAWIVENREENSAAAITGHGNNQQQQAPSAGSSSKKQNGTIQNISVIFDTLASKLGITPDVSSKSPPFQNKVRNRTPPPPLTAATPITVAKTRVVTTTTPKVTATQPPPTMRTTTQKITEPEIITIAGREEDGEYEYEDEVEEAEEEAATTTTTTTTTTTKKPRRKTTTKRTTTTTTTTSKPRPKSSKPATAKLSEAASASETRSSIRVAGSTSKLPPAVTTTANPTHQRRPATTTSQPRPAEVDPSIVSNPVMTKADEAVGDNERRAPVQQTTTAASVTESVIPPIFQLDPIGDDNVVPIILSQPEASAEEASVGGTYEMSSEAISFGKAEVEVVVDPDTVYADLLRKQITTKAPPLVTLLPVRSNSGIRTFRTPMQRRAGDIETRRAFAKLPAVPPPATIVRTSMRVGT